MRVNAVCPGSIRTAMTTESGRSSIDYARDASASIAISPGRIRSLGDLRRDPLAGLGRGDT